MAADKRTKWRTNWSYMEQMVQSFFAFHGFLAYIMLIDINLNHNDF